MFLWPMLWCEKSSLCEKSFLRPSFWEKSFWNRNFTWNIFFPKVILRDSALTNYILWLTHQFAPANRYKDFVWYLHGTEKENGKIRKGDMGKQALNLIWVHFFRFLAALNHIRKYWQKKSGTKRCNAIKVNAIAMMKAHFFVS